MKPDKQAESQTDQRHFWRRVHADRARVIVDGADYFKILRKAMLKAEKRIILIGWDFDTRISLSKDKSEEGDPPLALGDFVGPCMTGLSSSLTVPIPLDAAITKK